METTVHSILREIEMTEQVRIVYACESGSRAWGFPSADSDYDVRFIYARRLPSYLSIEEGRDVIERPISKGLDVNGWDLRKALQHLRKSNPSLFEWLGSPIVYMEKYSVASRMRELASEYFSTTACLYHYFHMARRTYEEHLKGETLSVKKYFYALRPILAMDWIDKDLGMAPTDFNVLVAKLITEPILKSDITRLLAAKREGAELDREPRITSISEFVESEIAKWEQRRLSRDKDKLPYNELDKAFRDGLEEVWRD